MKTKLIFASIIGVIFIAAMIIFHDTMTLTEIVLAFIGASGTIGWVWNWINAKEEKEERIEAEKNATQLSRENFQLRKNK